MKSDEVKDLAEIIIEKVKIFEKDEDPYICNQGKNKDQFFKLVFILRIQKYAGKIAYCNNCQYYKQIGNSCRSQENYRAQEKKYPSYPVRQ